MSPFARDVEPFYMGRDESCFGPQAVVVAARGRIDWAMTSMRTFIQDVRWKLDGEVRGGSDLQEGREGWGEGRTRRGLESANE
jgi:hypothetical protein